MSKAIPKTGRRSKARAHLKYQLGGEDRVAIFEDATSLRSNIAFLNSLGYPTVTLWSLGAEDPGLRK